jgi:Tol biopolymer transport system component
MLPTRRPITGAAATLAITLIPSLVAAPAAVATFPGDNGLIVFQQETDDGIQLFTMKPDGTDIRQITQVEAEPGRDQPGAGRADWSPDGRTIVFNENDCQIRLIDADGSNLREVPGEPGYTLGTDLCEADPSFTPDGRSIVYGRFDGQAEHIWRVDLDGTNRRLVTDACGIDPNVSPDATQLSCMGDGLWVVNMDGTDAKQVSPSTEIFFQNDWAPDGSAIVFADEHREGSAAPANIATVAPDGTNLRYLTDDGGNGVSYSPDGTAIVYRRISGDDRALFIMAADGSGARQITEFVPAASAPSFIDWGPAPIE